MRLMKNVFRRKGRTFLTIFGITIGVFALVVMGAMAEKITLLVDGGIKYYGDKVIVTDASQGGSFSMTPIALDKADELEKLDGVAAASPTLMVMLDEDGTAVSMGPPPMIVAGDLKARKYESFEIAMAEGRDLEAGDKGKAVVGCDLVEKLDAEVGGDIELHGRTFEVVGIMEKTLTAPDNEVVVPLADGQELFAKTLPTAVRDRIDVKTVASQLVVYPEKGVDPEKLADRIADEVKGVQATGPKAFEEEVVNATKMFSAIIFGIALISLLVGGLSVINTMTMAVAERTREIGVRKAIGASDAGVLRQFVAESGVIGIIGGLAGLALGYAVAAGLNAAGNESGTALFLVTARLAGGAVGFALVLGMVSGLYPAWRAARLNPVQALRYE